MLETAPSQRGAGPPPAGKSRLSERRCLKECGLLGEALAERVADVLELTVARTRRVGVDPALKDRAVRVSETSTIALGRWLAGEDPRAARDAGDEAWLFYGEPAAHRTASLNEVIAHCLCWRDAVAEVLQQIASQLDVPSEALSQALQMLQQGLEFGFIQISKSFDSERERTDEELAFMRGTACVTVGRS